MESKQDRKAAEPDYSKQIRREGRLVIIISAVAIFGNAMIFINTTPPMGEMGPFMHVWSMVCVGMSCWGIATGIGLVRRWPWSRISMLVFYGRIALCGAAAVGFFLMPAGNMAGWGLFLVRRYSISLALMPLVIGVRGLIFFRSRRVKAYFLNARPAPGVLT